MKLKKYFAFLTFCAVVSAQKAIAQNNSDNGNSDVAQASHEPQNWHAHHPIHIRINSSTGPSGYTPTQVKHAYGFDRIQGDGTGQTIGIVVAYGSANIRNDLLVFSTQFGLPAANLSIAYPSGTPTTSDSGWALETALDVEWAHAIAPAAKILLVVAPSSSFNYLLKAVNYATQYGAKQVSMSWGGSEFSGESYYDSYFNHGGVSYFAATGDSGAGVQWPSASNYVTAVGGSTLYLDSYGNRTQSEAGWSGSGGGTSAYNTEPSYQSIWQKSGKRTVPDVSYNSNPNTGYPVYNTVSYSGQTGWFTVGGTSAASPQWAAMFALVNSARAYSLSSANTAIYKFGSPTNYSYNFFDVTSGCNSTTSCSKAGLDNVTGIGTPQVAQLVPALRVY